MSGAKAFYAPAELRRRGAQIKLVVTDNDGVLTDAGVYYSDRGEELKRFNVRDGMGVERLRNVGIVTAILTRELSGSVKARAAKLKLPFTWLGVLDKEAHLESILEETGTKIDELAFIGDDVNDLGLMKIIGSVGLTAAPGDAMGPALSNAIYVCKSPGGHGAFREFAEWILSLREGST